MIGLEVLGGIFAVGNVGLVLSTIPAATGRGSPYMPTLKKSLDAFFKRVLPIHKPVGIKPPEFIDLGSGDGRVVIAAARNGYK